jgi:hypothetical protein
MEKEFVPYELALRMKQLGFDEPCFGFHSKIHGLMMVKTSGSSSLYKDAGECLAPTYSQAFRWFREKYGYLHHITYFDPVKAQIPGEADYQGLVLFPHQDVHKLAKISYDTYEETELECLKKLIEIVEQKEKV